MFLTKDAVRLALPGVAQGVACDGCPPLERLAEQYAEAGGRMLVCPYCFNSRKLPAADLLEHAEIGGATPLLEWMGDGATDSETAPEILPDRTLPAAAPQALAG